MRIYTGSPTGISGYWHFPNGSWWVYKLKGSSPAVYDRVTLYTVQPTYLEPGHDAYGNETCIWNYATNLIHSNTDHFPGDRQFEGIKGKRGATYLYSEHWQSGKWVTRSGSGIPLGEHHLAYPFAVGDTLGNRTGGAVISGIGNINTPYGPIHNAIKVVPILPAIDSTKQKQVSATYIAKNIGIVKLNISGNLHWGLVSYHINR